MNRSYEANTSAEKSDFEIKIQNPPLFEKLTNDSYLFVFAETSFNGAMNKNDGIWITARSNRDEFRKVNRNFLVSQYIYLKEVW